MPSIFPAAELLASRAPAQTHDDILHFVSAPSSRKLKVIPAVSSGASLPPIRHYCCLPKSHPDKVVPRPPEKAGCGSSRSFRDPQGSPRYVTFYRQGSLLGFSNRSLAREHQSLPGLAFHARVSFRISLYTRCRAVINISNNVTLLGVILPR